MADQHNTPAEPAFEPGRWYLSKSGDSIYSVVENVGRGRAMMRASPFVNRITIQVGPSNGEATEEQARAVALRVLAFLNAEARDLA